MTAAIGDYALIGDGRTAALISRDGELAWLCLPHFSSPSVFGSLLDPGAGGFRIGPVAAAKVKRRYRENTNVLETRFADGTGAFELIDAMPLPCGQSDARPLREILRCVEGLEGESRVRVQISPQPDYARVHAAAETRGAHTWAWSWGSHFLTLRSDVPLREAGDGAVTAEFTLRAGERRWFSLTYVHAEPMVLAPLGDPAQERLDQTARWWQDWSARAKYDGPHRDAVVRSALVLKLLHCSQSGAVLAAPTTSLPEWPGADRNWDYRYCWLRDAALTMRAFTGLGYLDEGRAFLGWLLHATRLTWPRLGVLYDLHGRAGLAEEELPDWAGFQDSRPVRIGNDARSQLQLDVYGAVCYAARNFVEATGELQRDEARLLRGFGREVRRCWDAPDNGIWEIRGPRRAYTFSRIMCWTALDSLLQLERAGHLQCERELAPTAQAIRDCVESRGFNDGLNSYVGVLDGADPDASVLLGGCLGYRGAGDARMRGTFDYVHRKLERNGLLMRYERGYDGDDTPEGAFGICNFFAIDHLAHRGEHARGWRAFEHVTSFANDVGLLAEEIDPDSGQLLGNFPQAYTHVGLINAALGLTRHA